MGEILYKLDYNFVLADNILYNKEKKQKDINKQGEFLTFKSNVHYFKSTQIISFENILINSPINKTIVDKINAQYAGLMSYLVERNDFSFYNSLTLPNDLENYKSGFNSDIKSFFILLKLLTEYETGIGKESEFLE